MNNLKVISVALLFTVLLSISGVNAAKRYVFLLDLSDSARTRQNWRKLQQSLGGAPVSVPHITLFGGLPRNKEQEIKDAVGRAREIFKKRYGFRHTNRTKLHINFTNSTIGRFGSFSGIRVNDVYIKEGNRRIDQFEELMNEIAKKFDTARIRYNKKSRRHYHVSAVKHARHEPRRIHFPGHVYIQCLALYEYDDAGAGQFRKITDFFFKHRDRLHVESDVRSNLPILQQAVASAPVSAVQSIGRHRKSVDQQIVDTLNSIARGFISYSEQALYRRLNGYSRQVNRLLRIIPHDSKKRRIDLDRILSMISNFENFKKERCCGAFTDCFDGDYYPMDNGKWGLSTSRSRARGKVVVAMENIIVVIREAAGL